MNRPIIAFLVAPLAAPVLLIPYIRSMTTTSTWFVFALIISTVMAYADVFIFGVPAYFSSAHAVGQRFGSPRSWGSRSVP